MGRTLFVRALLIVSVCLSVLAIPHAKANESTPLPLGGAVADPLDDLIAWLNQLCAFVHCSADRTTLEDATKSDWVVVRFIVSYESHGLRQDLSAEELKRARVATMKSLEVLLENPDELDPAVGEALFLVLASMEDELTN